MYGISEEKERRLRELYERLDLNKDGTIGIQDLTTSLKQSAAHILDGAFLDVVNVDEMLNENSENDNIVSDKNGNDNDDNSNTRTDNRFIIS